MGMLNLFFLGGGVEGNRTIEHRRRQLCGWDVNISFFIYFSFVSMNRGEEVGFPVVPFILICHTLQPSYCSISMEIISTCISRRCVLAHTQMSTAGRKQWLAMNFRLRLLLLCDYSNSGSEVVEIVFSDHHRGDGCLTNFYAR